MTGERRAGLRPEETALNDALNDPTIDLLLDFVQDVEGEMRRIIAADYRGPKPSDYAMAERLLVQIDVLMEGIK